ncbi:glycosyltransferase family 2 protein [Larkinella sp. GY13]|uniref:glycosyltransferase family 2 protein n=1 Tax=Larkinella sp. GY13 TaxID=3453720 RepID=UPI003EEFBF19
MKPFFSVIIPTNNSAEVISFCLESVLNQNFENFEILIMDAVSSDNTLSIAQSYYDNRIRIFSEHDEGIYDAMNKGIVRSKGEWLYFLGSDDLLYKENILKYIYDLISLYNKLDVLYGNVLMLPSNTIYDGEFTFEKMQTVTICHQAIFYKRSIFDDFGLYNIKYKVFADHDINLNWLFSDKHKNLFINVIIAAYSESGFSSYYKDVEFEADFDQKLFRLALGKYSFVKLKELALRISFLKKEKKEICYSIIYLSIYYVFRLLDLVKRRILRK